MTVTSTQFEVEYTGDGSQTVFNFTFPVFDTSWIDAWVTEEGTGGAYTVAINSNQDDSPGGSVTFATAPPVGEVVHIERVVPITQLTDYPPYTRFPSRDHEEALDKLTMIAQQIQGVEIISGDPETLSIDDPNLDGDVTITTITNVANGLLKLDGTGTIPVNLVPVTGGNEFPGPNPDNPLDPGATSDAAIVIGTVNPDTEESIGIGPSHIQARNNVNEGGKITINPGGGDIQLGNGSITNLTISQGLGETTSPQGFKGRFSTFYNFRFSAQEFKFFKPRPTPGDNQWPITISLGESNVGVEGPDNAEFGFFDSIDFEVKNYIPDGSISFFATDAAEVETEALRLIAENAVTGLAGGAMTQLMLSSPFNSDLTTSLCGLIVGTDDPSADPHIAIGSSLIEARTTQNIPAVLELGGYGGIEVSHNSSTRMIIDDQSRIRVRRGHSGGRNVVAFENLDASIMASVGYMVDLNDFWIANMRPGARVVLQGLETGGTPKILFDGNADDGHVKALNTVTGIGLERVLTESDIAGGGAPDSYSYSSAIVTPPDTDGVNALAIGDSAQAMVDDAISIGTGAQTFSPSSIAVGAGAFAPAPNGLALGHDASASSAGSIALGFGVSGAGNDSITIGTNAASGAGSVITIGVDAASSAVDCITLGNGAAGNGPDCITLGSDSLSNGQGLVTLGHEAEGAGSDSVAIGSRVFNGGFYSVAIGPDASVTGGADSAIIIKAGSGLLAAPGDDSITLATSATNTVEYYEGKLRLTNPEAQIIVPEHADASALSGENGSFVLETLTGLRYHDGTDWVTVFDDGNFDPADYATAAQGLLADSAIQPGDNVSELTNDAGYLAAEVNDLTAAVVWANVPDVNITQSSVVQHEGALTITESQISDLKNYVEFGEYGIGEGLSPEENVDYNTRVVPGNYLISSVGAVNPPTTAAYLLQVVTGSTALGPNDRVAQVAYGYTATELQIYARKLNGGTWSAWRQTYTTGNLSPVTVDTAQTITGKKSFSSPVNLPTYTDGSLPVGSAQDLVYISDGNEGLPALGLYDGAEWTYTPIGMMPYLASPLDLDTFVTPGTRFAIAFNPTGVTSHPFQSIRMLSKGDVGEYIVIEVEQVKDVVFSKGTASFVTQTARFSGAFTSACLVRRYDGSAWSPWAAKSGSFDYQSSDALTFAPTSASTSADLSLWKQGESIWLTGSVTFSSALNGSEDYNSGAVILVAAAGFPNSLAPASTVAVPLIPTFAASNSNPRLILNTDGTISVITDSSASTGEYFFSTRYLRI